MALVNGVTNGVTNGATNGVKSPAEDTIAMEQVAQDFYNFILHSSASKGFNDIVLENQRLRKKNAELKTTYDVISDTVEEHKKAYRDAKEQSDSKDQKLRTVEAEKKTANNERDDAQQRLEGTTEEINKQQESLKKLESKLSKVEAELAQQKQELRSALSAKTFAEGKQKDFEQKLGETEKLLATRETKIANLDKMAVKMPAKNPAEMCVDLASSFSSLVSCS